MVRKASQFPLKLDPQPSDFVVGLDEGNPDQFIRIPVGTLPQGDTGGGIDFDAIPIADAITTDDFVFGATVADPNTLIRIPINLLPLGSSNSSQKTSNVQTFSGILFLSSTTEYYQFLTPSSGLEIVKIPELLEGIYFECEIINCSQTSTDGLIIKTNDDIEILTLIDNPESITKGVYLFWDGSLLRIRNVEYFSYG